MGGHEHVVTAVVHAVAPDRRGQTADHRNEPSVGQVLLNRGALSAPHVDIHQRRLSTEAIVDRETDSNDGLLPDAPRYGIGVEAPDQRDGVHRAYSLFCASPNE